MFALSMLGILGCSGAAIDYIRLGNERTALAAATDSTALAGTTAALQADKAGKNQAAAKSAGEAAALAMWNANVGSWLSDIVNKPVIKVSKSGKDWSTEVTFDGTYATQFMNLLGIKQMRLYGHAVAATGGSGKGPEFWEFHIAVDTSNSMGIGATQSDMDALTANSQIKCSFACHYTAKSGPYKDTVAIAEAAGIKLRIDVVRDALAAMIAKMNAMSDGVHVKARLIGMDRTANELVALTNNLDTIGSYNLQLTPAVLDGTMSSGDTDYYASMAAVTTSLGAAGDGSAAAKAHKAVFIVTDGVHDSYNNEPNAVYNWTTHHHTGPIDPAFYATMKAQGVTVGVLYIDYIPPAPYAFTVNTFLPDILPNLKACASDNMFYNATTPDGISQAMTDMLSSTIAGSVARLTQ